MKTRTLSAIFESGRAELAQKLKDCSLPKDAQVVQTIVSEYFNTILDSEGEYRQSLTQSEDYILHAALQLLQAQQNITSKFAASLSVSTPTATPTNQTSNTSNGYKPIIGAGIGAIAGGVLGTWAAVCGAIAGTAVVIYCSNKQCKSAKSTAGAKKFDPVTTNGIDIIKFCAIIGEICQSIDSLMDTYRTQVKRVENIHAQTEKPSILLECQALFNQVANLHKVVEVNKDEIPPKVLNAINLLEESLENYGLIIKEGKVVHE